MIGSLRGRLLSKKPDNVIVEAGGVGYLVNVPINLLSALPIEGSEVFFYVHTHVREDALQLYGFPSEDEKKIFTTLLGVSGVGPKMALNILSGIPVKDFLHALDTEDVAMLCRIPGLGKKTAHRLILELKEKLPAAQEPKDRVFEDTLSALMNLGYKKSEAQEVLEMALKKGFTQIEDLLRESLRYLTGGRND
ncbi:MAG TPA: Holliday junction branch migration protein RuvA [Nitrospiraceae bacterium]|jgi:Holliday junction DNA helicase RuvA|nr:Holliday junction branch migration protein RuvA [Nitrospiraceae bacterium]